MNLHEELIRLQESSLVIREEVFVSDLSNPVITEKLNEVVDSLQSNPESIFQQNILDTLKSFLKYMQCLTDENICKLTDIILSAFNTMVNNIHNDIRMRETSSYQIDRLVLETYMFLWHYMVTQSENLWATRKNERAKKLSALGQKKKKVNLPITISLWDWNQTRIDIVSMSIMLVSLDLRALYEHTSDMDTVLSLTMKTVFVITYDPIGMKNELLKDKIVDFFLACILKYSRLFESTIEGKFLHEYLREEDLIDFVVSFLVKLSERSSDRILIENILRKFSSLSVHTDDTPIVRAFSKFIIGMSQKLPKEVMKQILYLQSHLYSESYMIRMAVIEAMGYLIYDTLDTSDSNTTMSSLSSYYEILKERHKDISSNVRVKVMQVVLKLSERRKNRASSSYIPLSLRSEFISLAISRLEDKSTNVRRNAIKLLVKFIETSPFILSQDSGSLSLELLNRRREALLHIIKDKCHMRENDMEVDGIADNYAQESTKEDIGSDLEDDNMDTNIQPEISAFQDLKVLLAYYSDAIAFVEMIKKAATIILQLMMSNSKSEAIEAMRFFMVCNAYEMDFAKEGIRTMIHKIWDKDTGETGRMSVKDTLVKYYTTLYIYNNSDRIDHNIAAMNLISLAVDMSLSELTSLEQLLCVISSLHINSKIVDSLWNIFSSSSEKYKNKLGAIIIIGMIAKSIPSVVTNNIKIIIEFLSSSDAVNNLLITRYVCVALVQLKYSPKKDYSKIRHPTICEPLISSIKNIILGESSSRYWFCFAEQAISATYLVCASPNKILSEIICALSKKCFSEEMINRLESDSLKYSEGNSSPKCQVPLEGSKIDLCKLFFVVGHIAIKQLVYLEELEQEWKQLRHAEISKAESVSLKSPSKIINKSLDAIMDTEDEINEFMRTVKEERLLYGKKSLLGVYGEIIAFVCSNNSSNDRDLQNMAIISLCKLMCVCSKFCENNLDMLLSILETSDCPVIRNNIIIGLGDMTMCFNSLLDKKISHLYDRLNDKDPSVRKNVLMLLSFLILNGIVRIKGQISLMAKCLDDKDPRISNIAKIFFSEFASRDNSVYNNFADIISNLLDENSGITETAFQNIFKTILEFMKKDRATENIIEKICQRFGNSYSESHWRSYSFCLASLAYQSERCMRKFMDCLPYYSNKLGSECIMSRFTETCIKAKKIATQEFKQVIENFEGVLKEAHEKCVQNQGSIERSMEELEKLRECGKVGPNEHTAN